MFLLVTGCDGGVGREGWDGEGLVRRGVVRSGVEDVRR